jgi:hypothetical protein
MPWMIANANHAQKMDLFYGFDASEHANTVMEIRARIPLNI